MFDAVYTKRTSAAVLRRPAPSVDLFALLSTMTCLSHFHHATPGFLHCGPAKI